MEADCRVARLAVIIVRVTTPLIWLVAMVVAWPGFVDYDSMLIRHEALTGRVNDWHPPVLVRLWQALAPGGSPAPLLVLGMTCYAVGFLLLASGLRRGGKKLTAAAVLAWGAMPLLVGWQLAVGKDSQMGMAMIAATGLVGHWRVRERPVPPLAVAAALVLLVYASLVRANAPFATVPLAMLLTGWRWRRRLTVGMAALAGILALTPTINASLFSAAQSPVYRSVPLYDLAGMVAFGAAPDGITPAERDVIVARRCYMPLYWDPLFFAPRCRAPLARLYRLPRGSLYALWLDGVVRHPLAYAEHRLAHLNQDWQLWVPYRRQGPPTRNWLFCPDPPHWETCRSPSREPRPLAWRIQRAIGGIAATPLGWPAVAVAMTLASLLALRRAPAGGPRTLAVALLGSVVGLEAGLAAIGIASEERYHLWALLAGGVGTILAFALRPRSRALAVGVAMVALIAMVGTWSRLSLPPMPPLSTYLQ